MVVLPRRLFLGLALLVGGTACSSSSSEGPNAPAGQTPASATTAKDLSADPAVKNATADQLVSQAMEAVDQRNYDRSLGLIDAALSKDATHRQALFLKGALLHVQANELGATDRAAAAGEHRKAADAMRALRAAHPDLKPQERGFLIESLYNEAGALAREGQPDAAMKVLKEAVDHGLDNPEAFGANEDLASLADRDDFNALRRQVADTASAGNREKVHSLLAENKPFPFTFTLPDLDGKPVALDDVKGKALTIVDIWGTWCPPCRMEIPHFVELYEQYKDNGLAIVGVNFEQTDGDDEARSLIRKFQDEYKITYPCVLGDEALLKTVPGFSGFPTTLFLDASGEVRLTLVGYNPKPMLEEIVKTLMAESGTDAEAPADTGETAPGE